MSQKRTYYGFTTPQQRQLLFETWEATGSVTQACRIARVSRGLFYYWKPRFEQHGYPGLAAFESRVAHQRHPKSSEIEQAVIALARQNQEWGKARLAQELAKANNWVAVVSPNTVKRILQDAGLWPEVKVKKKGSPAQRSADR
jgi:transposase